MPKNTNEEGILRVMVVPGKAERKMIVVGDKFDANQNTTTYGDKSFAEVREIQGAWLEVTGHEPGDYIELTIRGDLGEGEIDLGKHGETLYIPPSGKIEQIVSEGTVSLQAGWKLRVAYVAVSTGSPRTVYTFYRMRK